MCKIAAWNMLLRVQTELPAGLEVTADRFNEGWQFVRPDDSEQFKEEIQARGWSLTRFAGRSLGNGVGDTSQEATAGALKVALGHISQHHNTVEIVHIELAQYPWFFLARVGVCPFVIQPGAAMPVAASRGDLPIARPHRSQPRQSSALDPQIGSMMPAIREILVLARSVQGMPR